MSSQRCPIPLYPHPPLSPHRTQVESASDKHSNFPPIRERKSTPDPPISVPNHSHPRRSPVAQRQSERYSSPSEEPAPQLQLRHTPNSVAQKRTKRSKQHSSLSQEPAPSPSQLQQHLPNSGLGNRNRLNIMEAGVLVRHSKNNFESSMLKRGADVLEVENERPCKRKHVVCPDEDDMDWLKCEIKECMKEMAEDLRGNVEYSLLEELRLDIEELS